MKIIILKNGARIGPFNGAIWDEFSEKYQYQSIKKHNIEFPICTFKAQILCTY